jgi:hypothetical protein
MLNLLSCSSNDMSKVRQSNGQVRRRQKRIGNSHCQLHYPSHKVTHPEVF